MRAAFGSAFLVLLLSTLLLIYFVVTLDFTTNQTANGLWKSVNMAKWMDNLPEKRIEPSNLLYYPTYAFLSRILSLDNYHFTTWQKMAVVNAVFGGLSLAIFFLFIFICTRSVLISLLSTVFHLGCAFFFLLATISEDIIPAYPFFVASVLFLVLFAKTGGSRWLAISAITLTISWLFHWSMIAASPAFAGAILIGSGSNWRNRALHLAMFSSICVILAGLMGVICGVEPRLVLFPAKGLHTGWAGFNSSKFVFALAGIGQYLLGGRNLISFESMARPLPLLTGFLSWCVIIYFSLFLFRLIRSRWKDHALQVLALFVSFNLLAGEIGNIYSQPQDPQMQIEPMFWLPVAFAFFLWQRWHLSRPGRGALIFISCLPLLFNGFIFFQERGGDSFAINQVKRIEDRVDLDRTVFIMHGFDGMTVWPRVLSRSEEWKIITLADEAINYPRHSPEIAAYRFCQQIQRELQGGQRVVTAPFWDLSEVEFIDSMRTVSSPEKSRAMYRVLKERFFARFSFENGWGKFYDLELKFQQRAASR